MRITGEISKMRNNIIIFGKWEGIALLLNTVGARVFLNFPRNFCENSGTAGWIQFIYVTILAFLAFFVIEKLYSKFEGMDILDVAEQAGGNFLRILTGLIFTIQFFYIVAVILREYTENMKIVALTFSPTEFVASFFIIGASIAAYFGIEAISRFHAIAVPIIAVSYLFIQIGVMPKFDMTNLLPVLGNGVDKILLDGFWGLSLYGGLVTLFFMQPFLKTHRNFKISGYVGLSLSAFFLILGIVVYTGVFPYPTTTEFFLPSYQLSRMIVYGRFFQRVESVFFIIWASTAFMYLSLGLYILTYVFKKTFKLQYRRPLVLPCALLVFVFSLFPPNLTSVIELETRYYGYFGWAATFLLPLLVLAIGNIGRKYSKGGKNNE